MKIASIAEVKGDLSAYVKASSLQTCHSCHTCHFPIAPTGLHVREHVIYSLFVRKEMTPTPLVARDGQRLRDNVSPTA
jgi:hypothetical protein